MIPNNKSILHDLKGIIWNHAMKLKDKSKEEKGLSTSDIYSLKLLSDTMKNISQEERELEKKDLLRNLSKDEKKQLFIEGLRRLEEEE